MLKALIVLGPNPAEVMLADLLWPHADGDAAIRSLEITLHRLRKLLGDAALIRRTEGKLILDRKRIFVDVWALDALLEEVNAGAGGTEEELIACCRRLSTLHRGTYLHGENDLEWVLPIRQKLAQRYLQGIIALGCRCEARQLYHEAAALYQQAIEHQPRVEILYHRLISCHLETGRRPEALTLYKRYQMMLHSLGLTPNPATMTLVRSLLTT